MTTRYSAARNAGPALLDQLSGGATVSGSELGARLGISRAAVWKQVDRLRELGLGVVAQAGHGYRLDAPFEALEDRRREVARMVVTSDWGLVELRPSRLSLEEIFLQLTTDEAKGAAAAPDAA
jgi:biotin operon repressor BirA-like protein